MVTEQLQWMPYVNPKLHVPVIKFIYWSIRQIDTDIQVKKSSPHAVWFFFFKSWKILKDFAY